jgi:molybdopterin/thiamine biosynthesis adenylyltransferase
VDDFTARSARGESGATALHRTSGDVPPPTNAPSAIGSLAASLGILELQKLLAGSLDEALVGREVYLDARHHRHYVSRLCRNPRCRFDHQAWTLCEVGEAGRLTLGEALALGGHLLTTSELRVEGDAFVGELSCLECGRVRQMWKLRGRLADADRTCEACGGVLIPRGFDLLERLSGDRIPAQLLEWPLARFGLRSGEVFSIRAGESEAHYQLALEDPVSVDSDATVILAGCGNIGSHLVPHIARLGPGVGRVLLLDHDVYEAKNLRSQDIRADDLERPKVEVQAERLREIRSDLQVIAVAERLEMLPLSYFRNAFLLCALDSREARQRLNQVAWRTGSPWIDMAVDGAALLCRVSVYQPGLESPCLECGWGADDYRSLHQVLPCDESLSTDKRGRRRGGGSH